MHHTTRALAYAACSPLRLDLGACGALDAALGECGARLRSTTRPLRLQALATLGALAGSHKERNSRRCRDGFLQEAGDVARVRGVRAVGVQREDVGPQ